MELAFLLLLEESPMKRCKKNRNETLTRRILKLTVTYSFISTFLTC